MLIILFFTTIIILLSALLYLAYEAYFNENTWKNKAKKLKTKLENEKVAYTKKEDQIRQKAYQAEVLRELSERIGYSLDIPKIVEVITGSLGEVLDYNTASYLLIKNDRLIFHCFISRSINHQFIKDVRSRMVAAFSIMLNKDVSSLFIEETISGTILDDTMNSKVNSFFNLPLVINNKPVGLINVASPKKNLYTEEQTKILYTITQQAANHYEKLKSVLEEEKRRLNAMVASMADGVLMLDKEGKIIVFNPAAKKMLGLAKVKKPTILDLANNLAGKVALRTKLEEAIKKNKVVEQKDIYLQNKALHLLISPVKDNAGELLGSAILFRDISAQKELEQIRQEFTAMMVHELRAPLTTIKGTTDMLLKDKRINAQTRNKLLMTMYTDNEHMLELVSQLLDVAKIEAGKFQIEPLLLDLAKTLKEVVEKFKPQAMQKNLELTTQITKNVPKIYFDKIRIEQVLNNLLSNAIKYTEKGYVKVLLEKDKNNLIVKVKDNGAGMTEEEVANLFSKFKQLGKGKTGKIKGTGLGLVIAKGIVETHKGKIWAESEGPGKGSMFSFSLPIKQKLQSSEKGGDTKK